MQSNSKYFKHIFTSVIFMSVCYLIFRLVIQKEKELIELRHSLTAILSLKTIFLLGIIVLLTPLNWGLEALKWQYLVEKIEKISFRKAYESVLVGLSMGMATPFMLGDYVGKIMMLESNERIGSAGAIFLGNGLQTYVSIIFGTIGYLFFMIAIHPQPFQLHWLIAGLLVLTSVGGIFVATKLSKLVDYKIFSKLSKYLIILKKYSFQEINILFLLTVGRYLIFSWQYLLIFVVFEVKQPIMVLLAGIFLIFLAKTLASTLNFIGDLSFRSITAIYYFAHFNVSLSVITLATLFIWLINVLMPMLVGSMFIYRLKLSIKI